MISDTNKFRAVGQAYVQVMRAARGAELIKVQAPGLFKGKHWENCLSFYAACERWDLPLASLVLACLEHFPPLWCKSKFFGRRYPPITMLVSEGYRERALKYLPETLPVGRPDKLPEFYADQLAYMRPHKAKELVLMGFFDLDAKIKQEVLDMLDRRCV